MNNTISDAELLEAFKNLAVSSQIVQNQQPLRQAAAPNSFCPRCKQLQALGVQDIRCEHTINPALFELD